MHITIVNMKKDDIILMVRFFKTHIYGVETINLKTFGSLKILLDKFKVV
jgi:hypothetical protein